MDHSRLPFLLGLAWMCALLSATTATALGLPTPLNKLGDDKCLAAPENLALGQPFVVVNCSDHDPTDTRLHFVFDTNKNYIGEIKLFADQTLCVDVPNGELNEPLQLRSCVDNQPVNRQFLVFAVPPRIQWQGDQTSKWTISGDGDRVVLAPTSSDDTTQGWKQVNSKPYPFVRIELDGNKCLFAQKAHADGTALSTVTCSAHAPTDPRLRFVVDGGFLRLYNNQNFCVNVPQGQPDRPVEMRSCNAAGVQITGKFVIRDDYVQLQTGSGFRLTDNGAHAVVATARSIDQSWLKSTPAAGQPSRIQLGDDKCMIASTPIENYKKFQVVNCSDYARRMRDWILCSPLTITKLAKSSSTGTKPSVLMCIMVE
jgi:hypothetical protein